MIHLRTPLLRIALTVAAIVGLTFAAVFAMVFSGDPGFARPLEVSPEEMAAFAAHFEQPYPAEARIYTVRDGTALTAHVLPAADSPITLVMLYGALDGGYLHNRGEGLLREATGAEVVALDLRGHGGSGGAPGDVAYTGQYEDDFADVVAAIRAARPGGRVILAGHSMGGGVALRYAAKDGMPPVDGYLLVAPHLGPTAPTTPDQMSVEAARFVALHVPRIIGLALLNDLGIRAFNGLQTLFFNLPHEVPLRSYTYRAMVGMYPDDYRAALAAIHQPLLVMAGSADESFRADRYPAAVTPHAKGEVVIVPDATHDGVLEDPRALAAIARWMSRD